MEIMDRKEIEERHSLIETIELFGLELSEIIIRENPDFKLKIGEKTIGAEVTGYYIDAGQENGSKARTLEKDDEYIMKIVNEKLRENSNLKDIGGSVSFKNQERPKEAKLRTFLDELERCAVEYSKNKNFKERIDVELTDDYPTLKKYLSLFTLDKALCRWDLTRGGAVGFSEDNLMKVIQPKIDRATEYKKSGIDELWVIVGGSIHDSQVVPPPRFVEYELKNSKNLDNALKSSGFNKVYLYFSFNKVVYEWPKWIRFIRNTATSGYKAPSNNCEGK